MSTFETIKGIIVEELGVEADKILLETNFENDLDADSLDLFQVINEIEDELDITIDTDENIQTVSDLVNYIEAQK
ncbi:acyl carrier protein [Facklamia sp. DSM 111018]|uniref:Acyl carrier protein n=1 Tax=Facklamia lactis TaxID=2749967 RepID=A0ABS0LSP3_9LACT|nr:acyl carrier protein [Facklamia lactis]MBG9981341.1 acyl carrier protein [Facklamia lactis]MBG9987183.1 acyl carrier protein [Facklamia lactis]